MALISAPSTAADFYVDVANGSDANAGTSPGQAWKTLTRASMAAPPGSGTTIHVAPGVYAPSSGEVFPLRFDQQALVADQGPAVTSIDGQSEQVLIQMSAFSVGLIESLTRIEGITMRGTAIPIRVSLSQGAVITELVDCRLEPTFHGIVVTSGDAGASLFLVMRNVTIVGGQRGMSFNSVVGQMHASLFDCSIRNCSQPAISHTGQGFLTLSLSRTRLENNGSGIDVISALSGGGTVNVEDSLIAHNGEGFRGATSTAAGSGIPLHATFRRCTVADNLGTGVAVVATGSHTGDAAFDGCIVQGNGTNVGAGTPIVSNLFTQIGGADPQFVDRVNGDYRLRFGSPCIDVADPVTPSGTLDLAGTARSIDGDLDTNERADIGALEHMPLRLVTNGHIGMPLRLEMSGQAGGTTTVYFTRGAPVSPASTPFGQFDLNPATFGTLLTSAVAPFPPIGFQRPIPNSPHLIGVTFSFQALTSSTLAPQGFAYTNVVTFTVLP